MELGTKCYSMDETTFLNRQSFNLGYRRKNIDFWKLLVTKKHRKKPHAIFKIQYFHFRGLREKSVTSEFYISISSYNYQVSSTYLKICRELKIKFTCNVIVHVYCLFAIFPQYKTLKSENRTKTATYPRVLSTFYSNVHCSEQISRILR